VGPLIFKPKDAPEYNSGFLIVTVTAICAALLAIVYRYVCVWENKRRDRNGTEAFDHAYEDDLTDIKVCIGPRLVGNVLLTSTAESAVPLSIVVVSLASRGKRRCGSAKLLGRYKKSQPTPAEYNKILGVSVQVLEDSLLSEVSSRSFTFHELQI